MQAPFSNGTTWLDNLIYICTGVGGILIAVLLALGKLKMGIEVILKVFRFGKKRRRGDVGDDDLKEAEKEIASLKKEKQAIIDKNQDERLTKAEASLTNLDKRMSEVDIALGDIGTTLASMPDRKEAHDMAFEMHSSALEKNAYNEDEIRSLKKSFNSLTTRFDRLRDAILTFKKNGPTNRG